MGVADGVVWTEVNDTIGSAIEVDEIGTWVEDSAGEGDGESKGEALGVDSDEIILLQGSSKEGDELRASWLDTLEIAANLERSGFSLTRKGRRLWLGRVRNWLLVTRVAEVEITELDLNRISLLKRGVSN